MKTEDRNLKHILQSDKPPKLPDEFVTQTVNRLSLDNTHVVSDENHAMAVMTWAIKHKWFALGVAVFIALIVQHHLQSSIEEELLHIDTLSMYSLSVL